MATKLVAEGKDADGVPIRVVMVGTRRVIERASRDALGNHRWTEVGEVDLARSIHPPVSGSAAAAILHVLDDVATKQEAVAETMTYSPRNRHG